jgi:hypothetical protein
MVIFMTIFSGNSDSEFSANVAIVDENPNATSAMLLQQISHIPVLEIETGDPISREKADELVKTRMSMLPLSYLNQKMPRLSFLSSTKKMKKGSQRRLFPVC